MYREQREIPEDISGGCELKYELLHAPCHFKIKFTPNFCSKITFTTLKIESVIQRRLIHKNNYLLNCYVCYNHICDSEEKYLGET